MTRGVLAAVVVGLAGCAAPAPTAADPAGPALRGEWTSLDTLTYTVTPEGGVPVEARTLWSHLSIADSVWTETSVVRNPPGLGREGLEGWEVTATVRAEGDSVVVRYDPTDDPARGHVAIRGDTLHLTFRAEGEAGGRQRFVRRAPTGVPASLLGPWVGLSPPDDAGVPAEFGFRFLPDGTYEDGWGDAQGTFRVLGPFLLLNDGRTVVDGEGMRPLGTAFEWRVEAAVEAAPGQTRPALVLSGGGDRLVLFRPGR